MSEIGNKPRMDCAVDAAMSIIEGRWKATILCKLILKGTFRFNQLIKEMDGVSPRILTKQLRELERDGLITRKEYQEIPPRVEYSITPLGRSLGPILSTLAQWGLKNMFSNVVKMDDDIVLITPKSTKATAKASRQ